MILSMDEKNLFALATDDTAQVMFREALRAIIESAERKNIRRDYVADMLVLYACSMMGGDVVGGNYWLNRTIAVCEEWRDDYAERKAVLVRLISEEKRDREKIEKAASDKASS